MKRKTYFQWPTTFFQLNGCQIEVIGTEPLCFGKGNEKSWEKNCWQKQKGEINCLQALEEKNKKNIRQKSTKVWPSHCIQTRLFLLPATRGELRRSLYNLKTARDTVIRILSRYHLIDTMTLNLLAESKFHFNFPSKQQKSYVSDKLS